jgi:hypothetical protein
MICGYQAAFECFCNLGYDAGQCTLMAHCVKVVSDRNDLRVGYQQKDEVAATRIETSLGRANEKTDES